MKKIIPIALLSLTIITTSCSDDKNEDVTEQVNKNGAVETSVSVEHLDSLNDVLVTKHAVWVKGNQFKNFETKDTIPTLGMENVEAENKDGDTKTVSVKKDYEIFITVK